MPSFLAPSPGWFNHFKICVVSENVKAKSGNGPVQTSRMCPQLIGPRGAATVAGGAANWHRRTPTTAADFWFNVLFLPPKEIAFAGFWVLFCRHFPSLEAKSRQKVDSATLDKDQRSYIY